MEFIGRINRRRVYYVPIRNNPEWKSSLPKNDWVVFTIADKEDEEWIPPVVKICLDQNVSYTCSTGGLAHRTEDYFDEEISWRGVNHEIRTKKEFDYEKTPVTTSHENFGEGFWFASTVAHGDNFDLDKVICLDFTKRKVRKHLTELMGKINSDWLPSDDETQLAEYDT